MQRTSIRSVEYRTFCSCRSKLSGAHFVALDFIKRRQIASFRPVLGVPLIAFGCLGLRGDSSGGRGPRFSSAADVREGEIARGVK